MTITAANKSGLKSVAAFRLVSDAAIQVEIFRNYLLKKKWKKYRGDRFIYTFFSLTESQ